MRVGGPLSRICLRKGRANSKASDKTLAAIGPAFNAWLPPPAIVCSVRSRLLRELRKRGRTMPKRRADERILDAVCDSSRRRSKDVEPLSLPGSKLENCPLRGVSATTGEVTAVGYIAFSPESVAHAGSCESGEPCRLKSEGIGSAARARGAATEVKRMGDGDDRRSSYMGASACSQQRLNPARRDAASRAATPLRTTACASDYYQEPGANSSRRADVSKFRTCRPASSPDSVAT